MTRAVWVVIALGCTGAFAQERTVVHEPDRVIARQKSTIDFTVVEIESNRAAPADSYVLSRPKPGFAGLIKVRGNFVPELQRSVDQL